MSAFKVYYDPEGDFLEIQFGTGTKNQRTGIGLTGQITLFCDSTFERALGFTALAYSKLLILPERSLTELRQAPEDIQVKVKDLLNRPPLHRFLYLVGDRIGVQDVRISELART